MKQQILLKKNSFTIGQWFYDENQQKIREEFVGYVELTYQDELKIASAIQSFLVYHILLADNCIEFGFDGCSKMAGKEDHFQEKVQ